MDATIYDLEGNRIASILTMNDKVRSIILNKDLNKVEISDSYIKGKIHPFYDIPAESNLKEINENENSYILLYESEAKPGFKIDQELDKETCLMKSIVFYTDYNDKRIVYYETKFFNYDTKTELKDNVFNFVIPENATVVDERKKEVKDRE